MKMWTASRDMILKANQVVRDYEKGRKLGRLTRATTQAHHIVLSFVGLIGEIAAARQLTIKEGRRVFDVVHALEKPMNGKSRTAFSTVDRLLPNEFAKRADVPQQTGGRGC